MTVKELVEVLKDYDEDATILLVCSMDEVATCCHGELVTTLSDKSEVRLFADCH